LQTDGEVEDSDFAQHNSAGERVTKMIKISLVISDASQCDDSCSYIHDLP